MIIFENYTDKNEMIQDCLEQLESFIEGVIESEEQYKIIDCSDIEADIIILYISLVV